MGDFVFHTWEDIIKTSSNHLKNWRDMFIRIRGRDGASIITTKEDEAPNLPLSWMEDPMESTNKNYPPNVSKPKEHGVSPSSP